MANINVKNTTTINTLNRYQETGTVIYTGDGIATIKGLTNVQAGELLLIQPNNVAGLALNLNTTSVDVVLFGDNCLVACGNIVIRQNKLVSIPTGRQMLVRGVDIKAPSIITKRACSLKKRVINNIPRRSFTTIPATQKNGQKETLEPIKLPNASLWNIVGHTLLNITLFAIFAGQRFLEGVCLLLFIFIILLIYYFIQNRARLMLFWKEMLSGMSKQPKTVHGWVTKIRLAALMYWITVAHFFFYTNGGFTIWSTCVVLGVVTASINFCAYSVIPPALVVFAILGFLGLNSFVICSFRFWRERSKPFLYNHINKNAVLLVVENMFSQRLGVKITTTIVAATAAGVTVHIGSAISADATAERCYRRDCEHAAANNQPMPVYNNYRRQTGISVSSTTTTPNGTVTTRSIHIGK